MKENKKREFKYPKDEQKEKIEQLNSEIKQKLAESQKKTMKKIFLILAIFVVVIVVGFFSFKPAKNFEYRGITGNVIKEGNIIFYQTSLPTIYNGEIVPYNFYLRNNPKKLDKIPFSGEIEIRDLMVINASSGLECEGYGNIAVANLINLYNILGTKVVKDEKAKCDESKTYTFIHLEKSDKNAIEEYFPGCYTIYVKDCEILKPTEKFMVETIIKVKEMIV